MAAEACNDAAAEGSTAKRSPYLRAWVEHSNLGLKIAVANVLTSVNCNTSGDSYCVCSAVTGH